jgi:hypothetical protein
MAAPIAAKGIEADRADKPFEEAPAPRLQDACALTCAARPPGHHHLTPFVHALQPDAPFLCRRSQAPSLCHELPYAEVALTPEYSQEYPGVLVAWPSVAGQADGWSRSAVQ